MPLSFASFVRVFVSDEYFNACPKQRGCTGREIGQANGIEGDNRRIVKESWKKKLRSAHVRLKKKRVTGHQKDRTLTLRGQLGVGSLLWKRRSIQNLATRPR